MRRSPNENWPRENLHKLQTSRRLTSSALEEGTDLEENPTRQQHESSLTHSQLHAPPTSVSSPFSAKNRKPYYVTKFQTLISSSRCNMFGLRSGRAKLGLALAFLTVLVLQSVSAPFDLVLNKIILHTSGCNAFSEQDTWALVNPNNNENSESSYLGTQRGEFIEGWNVGKEDSPDQPWITSLPVDKVSYPRVPVDDLQLLPVRARAKTIAVVTSGLKPFNKFGGIGTMFYNYIQLYLAEGFVVHVYYAGHIKHIHTVKDDLKEFNLVNDRIHIHLIDEPDDESFATLTYPKVYGTIEMESSNQIYLMLKHESTKYSFDTFLFHDYRGIATATIQAKRAGIAFLETTIIVVCHTSSYNSAFFNARLTTQNEAVAYELEDYTRNYADVVVFVSQALCDQLAKLSIYDNLDTPAKKLIMPNFVYGDLYDRVAFNDFGVMENPTKFAFFGRLDTLKGIDVFFEAIRILVAKVHADPELTSIGEIAIIGDYPLRSEVTRSMVDERAKELSACGINLQQFNNLMTVEAAQKMLDEGYVAVLPSLYENYPMALLEALYFGVPVIHGDAGGQSEVSKNNYNIFHHSDPRNLAAVMARVMKEGIKQDHPAVTQKEVHESYVKLAGVDSSKFVPLKSIESDEFEEMVEDCSDVTFAIITFLKRFEETKDLLIRLMGQSCSKFKVILFVNSPCEKNVCFLDLGDKVVAHFGEDLRVLLPPRGSQISVSDARNIMIREVQTKFTVLFDDDDVPRDDFIEVMKKATVLQGADLMTSHAGFVEERPSVEDVTSNTVNLHHVSLAGGNTGPAANFHVHHTGKANVLLRTSFAQRIGPCLPELSIGTSPFVDWGMYTNYILNKAKIGVVPESMYYYKMHSTGSIFYESTDFTKYLGAKKIVNEYCRFYKLDTMGCEVLWMAKQIALKKK